MKYLFLLLISFPAVAQMTPVTDVELFRRRLSDAGKQLASIRCDFEQYRHLAIMDDPLVSSGKFFFRKDNMVRLEYDKPSPYLIVLNAQKVKTVKNGTQTVYDMSSYRMMTALKTMLSACLTGDFSGAGKDYRMSAAEDNASYNVVLEPLNRNIKKYLQKIEITFDKQNLSANQLIIYEPSGDFTKHVFTNKQLNLPLSDDLFAM
jgi:outer membrane lipoprotein-sorting protein